MKNRAISLAVVSALLAFSCGAQAQTRTLASTMEVYVFPKEGQTAEQQSQDEAACYEWAASNTGSDPFELADQQVADQQQAQAEQQAAAQSGQGSGARGAVRGAAAGAVIGEIADDDAGKGAAWGAAAGTIRGRRKGAQANAQLQQQAASQAEQREQATTQQLENFKKAFGVCLEAKDYMVK
jgi:hypothetical protein